MLSFPQVTAECRVKGHYRVEVTLRRVHIRGSPFQVHVTKGELPYETVTFTSSSRRGLQLGQLS